MRGSLTFGRAALVVGGMLAAATSAAQGQPPTKFDYFEYHGMCEASAAVAVDSTHFLVADDQDSILRLYQSGNHEPIDTLDLSAELGIPPSDVGTKDGKTDIEGAAAIGHRIYWITGHSERWSPQRRFFATDVIKQGKEWRIELVGTPYRGLRDDLLEDKTAIDYIKNPELRDSNAKNGFNIEGLAATPDGELLIGLRNPVPEGKALLVTLKNPHDVVVRGKPAKFGKTVPLDLGDLGIRSIDRVNDGYLIIAGSFKDEPGHSLYRWSGIAGAKPEMLIQTIRSDPDVDFRPEALFAIPGSNDVQLLGDEGDVETKKAVCKKAPKQEDKKFRSVTITFTP